MIEVGHKETNSIKSITIKKIEVDVSTCFIKRNMLTFAKHSLKSFVCDFVDTFCFPTHKVREIYAKNDIIKCCLYLNFTDTDSCSFFLQAGVFN